MRLSAVRICLVLRQALGEGGVPFFEFASQSRDFALQLTVGGFHPVSRGHECLEGLRQRAFDGAGRQDSLERDEK